jgi:hypothetical protein
MLDDWKRAEVSRDKPSKNHQDSWKSCENPEQRTPENYPQLHEVPGVLYIFPGVSTISFSLKTDFPLKKNFQTNFT